MKKRIGISIYPSKTGVKETIDYIKLAHKYGVRRVFANLLEINNTGKGIEKLGALKQTLTFANKMGMEVIVDVSPTVYKSLGLEYTEYNFFKKVGATGIRLDEDFNGEVESELSKNITVELNASSGTTTMTKTIEKGGIAKNLIACHNFYPMEYTGLGIKNFINLSSEYKKMGTKVASFITLPRNQEGVVGPWDVNDGIPTLEIHRGKTLSEQVRHYMAMDIVDDIIFSEQGVTEEQFKVVQDLLFNSNFVLNKKSYEKLKVSKNQLNKYVETSIGKNPTLIFEIEDMQKLTKVEKAILFNFPHNNRQDVNEYFIRSTYSRIIFKEEIIKPKKNDKEFFEPGDIVILNEKYNRYKGELHIITKRIPYTGKRNYVGKISLFDHNLLEFARPGRGFKIIKKGEKNVR
ncbi:MupG family TIM beta-alpha barrel fold protein [Mycoplasma marinum]|uniref:DUF871 domain-containing protein n=1 Tax=Mycoplasma marinum TaxID=1937190 RepID=A0A4R0XUY5_9MOLU|nr:MupG family TIM beta-alpha barrel fold protein [Mycoplasma marinum]TCG10711.1 hypothetical protein C4B24_04160 [Mycoplasma marinum]